MLEGLEAILKQKAMGKSDAEIKLSLSLSSKEYNRRLAHIEKNQSVKKLATALCQESVLRMKDTRDRLMGVFALYYDPLTKKIPVENAQKATQTLAEISRIDERIVRTALQLGFIPMPEQTFTITDIRTGETEKSSYDDLYRTYVGRFGDQAVN